MDKKLGHKIIGNQNGKPLAILHGWGVDSSYLNSIAAHYKNRRVMLIDLPGYGMSKNLCQYSNSFNDTVDLIYNTLEPDTDLISWSLSTLFALKVSTLLPYKVTSLVTICGSPRFPSDPNWPGVPSDLIIKCKQKLNSKRVLFLISYFFKHQLLHCNKEDEESLGLSLKELESKFKELDSNTLLNGIDLMANSDQREDLKYLKIPSLHIFGAKDLLVPCALAQYCAKSPQRQCYVFPYSGHMPFLSEATSFYHIIDDFYASVAEFYKKSQDTEDLENQS